MFHWELVESRTTVTDGDAHRVVVGFHQQVRGVDAGVLGDVGQTLAGHQVMPA
jgi:hypothetical protein